MIEKINETLTLARTGLPPLRIPSGGTLLAEGAGSRVNGRDQTRWHEVDVYRTPGGQYVVTIRFRSRWDGESDFHVAESYPTPAGVIAFLQSYDPTEHVAGYPAGPAYVAKQERMVTDLRRRFAVLTSEIYAQLGPDFAEVVS